MQAFRHLGSFIGSGIDILSESITHRHKKQLAVVSEGRNSPIPPPRVLTSFLADQSRNRRNAPLLIDHEQRFCSSRAIPDSEDDEEGTADPNYEDQLTLQVRYVRRSLVYHTWLFTTY